MTPLTIIFNNAKQSVNGFFYKTHPSVQGMARDRITFTNNINKVINCIEYLKENNEEKKFCMPMDADLGAVIKALRVVTPSSIKTIMGSKTSEEVIKTVFKDIAEKCDYVDNLIEIKEAKNNLNNLINHVKGNVSILGMEGIFRISSVGNKRIDIHNALNSNGAQEMSNLLNEINDPAAFSSEIKKQFGLVLSNTDKNNLSELAVCYAKDKKLPKISELPSPLQKLMPLLAEVVSHERSNKMNAKNLATIIAPNITARNEDCQYEMHKIPIYTQFLTALIDAHCKLIQQIHSRPLPATPDEVNEQTYMNMNVPNRNDNSPEVDLFPTAVSLLGDIDKELSKRGYVFNVC
ncbi:RhoGAP domain-containing protein [Yersinia kristensenii]|uniref:RhoGAP domain-containing protein n=1 Tax=Yersinia kristensenii TaxID=28152 RepID=UPI0005DF1980|nr:RhoGAP domain-containing protein [Yersinia kristensenii]CNF39985.1 RhoGAP domain [Yersinia kristensenii]